MNLQVAPKGWILGWVCREALLGDVRVWVRSWAPGPGVVCLCFHPSGKLFPARSHLPSEVSQLRAETSSVKKVTLHFGEGGLSGQKTLRKHSLGAVVGSVC